ncbi:23S rRNA (adenine(1618)-N(6))-methyltransferase RlmF [Daejeonella sp. H1SJ63]|jgi:23S rRNA (adenine1618-N6)-methyltransferase|uniref:23S rRNA (adenine(1618)-N(6))-methyltransferase RlmF n=1 Tax=Daejeonella sp. H1SJ63 TaxID=3034145 RepID=UPI0023EB95C8|nr:23S rRNA (adenine(1618)-N(6))-methyltransferase RlmF [Daejeonella sp. H1SJ63]
MDQPSSISKHELHPRNKHRGAYDFPKLIEGTPELADHVFMNQFHHLTLDFADSVAVKALNKALLRHFYRIELWDIPDGYLCPPIPGRADYIHYAADLMADKNGNIPRGKNVRVLDIGVGANCIYPLIGHQEYGWTFVGSEIDQLAIRSARNIIEANGLAKFISIRKQNSAKSIFKDIIHRDEKFDLTICNPPFHSSMKDAAAGTERKWKNLGKDKKGSELLNFGGKNAELWCEGGEQAFLLQMISESAEYAGSVKWFTSLVSKKESLPACYRALENLKVAEVRTMVMKQGQKESRILAWRL